MYNHEIISYIQITISLLTVQQWVTIINSTLQELNHLRKSASIFGLA